MAIEGALADVSLADISQLLAMGRKTGCLSLTDQGNFGYIYFPSTTAGSSTRPWWTVRTALASSW